MAKRFLSPLRRFARETRGNMVIELLFVMPLFLWAILGTIIYFYGFQMRASNLNAAYTISDLLSREMEGPITPAYIEGIDEVFNYLSDTSDELGRIRVTLVVCTDKCGPDDTGRELDIDWSYGTDGLAAMTEADLASEYEPQIPLMPANERVIVVESQVLYEPPVWFGVEPMAMQSFIVTRPRFVPKLEWDDGSSGSGV